MLLQGESRLRPAMTPSLAMLGRTPLSPWRSPGCCAVDIWVDRERIAGGKPVDAEIVGALRDSAALLCLVSPSWLKKDYCLWEAEVFSNDFGFMRPIIPLLRMPRDPAKLPRYLIRLN